MAQPDRNSAPTFLRLLRTQNCTELMSSTVTTRLTNMRRRVPPKLAKFVAVGSSGVMVNSLALYCLHQLLAMAIPMASALAVEIAILNNFIWNDRWTFRQQRPSLRRFVQFNAVSLGGLLITTACVWVLSSEFGIYYLLANLVGIFLATAWNFGINLHWTWGSTRMKSAHNADRAAPTQQYMPLPSSLGADS